MRRMKPPRKTLPVGKNSKEGKRERRKEGKTERGKRESGKEE
jgi:hypothetical protein